MPAPTTSSRRHRRSGLHGTLAGVLLVMAVAGTGTAQSQDPEPTLAPYPATVADPAGDALGASHATWAERWWTWLLTFPSAEDPSLATTCPVSPADGPLILPQTFFGMVQQLTCPVEAGRAVLVTAGGTLCTLDPGMTDDDLLACVKESDADLESPSIAVDGRILPDIEAHHVFTEPFEFEVGADNLLGVPAGTVRAAASGWMALLSDLAPGTHTIVLRDEQEDPAMGRQLAEAVVILEVAE